jgi:predicted exporter
MARSGRLVLFVWIGLIALSAYFIEHRLRVSGDLRLFMPAPHSAVERLLLEEVSEGPASRLLLLALKGAAPDELAESSQRLAASLRADPAFRLVANGEYRLDFIPEALLPYRYLLSPTLDHARLDASFLRAELTDRERDLASPAASLLEPLLPRDPTLEIVKLLSSWEPAHEPQQIDEVWFDARGVTALLIVETAAAAFDPQGQRAAIDHLQNAFARARTSPAARLTVSGPGEFSVMMQGRSEADARLAGILDTVGMIALMFLAYRRVRYVLLGALPLATAGVVGLATVTALFGTVHGITIAFGFTLIGVAIDYPIFLFSHELPGVAPVDTARAVWPTLATAVLGICVAYLAFLASGVVGLEQLACFNVAGLAAAGLVTRYLLPQTLGPAIRDHGEAILPQRLARLFGALPRPGWAASLLCLLCVAVLLVVPGPLWENDLGRLTPVPQRALQEYEELHEALGAPDVRYLAAVDGASADEVLAREEGLRSALQALVARRAISGFDDAARYLPSVAIQLKRRAALPDAHVLADALDEATRGMAFRPGLFAPFLKDVARARELPPLTPAGVAGTPLELSMGSLLIERGGRWSGLVTFTDVRDPRELASLQAASGGAVTVLDLKQASEDLVAHQRERILWSVGFAALLLVGVVYLALRSVARARRVLTPMALATLVTLAALHGAGLPMNLFHLIALVLAAGLGLDYGLFCERSSRDPSARRRTLHALLVCAAAACTVFAVLATSALPVLRSIGITVVIGVVGNFVLALALIRAPRVSA